MSKVEICGVDTSRLRRLTYRESEEMLSRIKEGDASARETFALANARLVLSIIKRFPQAKVSSDFSYCKIYVAPLDAQNVAMAELVKTLNESRRYFRGILAKAMRLRVAPEVRFYADETQEVAAHIDELLNSPQVKRDLEKTPDDDGRA